MPFRFQSRHVFLTYAKCENTPQELLSHLRSLEDFNAYTISTEFHNDGTKHLHALLEFARKLRHSDERRWDYNNRHPNIVSPRAITATREYIKKNGDYIEEGWVEKAKPYGKILFESTSKAEFLGEIRLHHARDYVNNFDRIVSMADAHWKDPEPEYIPQFTNFLPCTALDEWLSSSLVSPLRSDASYAPSRGRAFLDSGNS